MKREAASLRIQTNFRCHFARNSYAKLKVAVIALQTGIRVATARDKFRYKKRTRAAILIQAHERRHKVLSYFKKLIWASIFAQSRWRGIVARREFRKLKTASRETGALIEAKDKLEKQVEQLKLQLQSEKRLRIDLEEAKDREIVKLQNLLRETNMPFIREHKAPSEEIEGAVSIVEKKVVTPVIREHENSPKEIEGALSIVEKKVVPLEDAERIEALTGEVEHLKVLLKKEKQRADNSERICVEAKETMKDKCRKLEDTERKVQQLQDSLNRMIYSISDQFSELKSILHPSSSSQSTSALELVSRGYPDDATSASADATTSTNSTFAAPGSTPPHLSSPDPHAFQLIVQDLAAADISGSGNWENDREGVFDDFF